MAKANSMVLSQVSVTTGMQTELDRMQYDLNMFRWMNSVFGYYTREMTMGIKIQTELLT